jgi:hypothetical protein
VKGGAVLCSALAWAATAAAHDVGGSEPRFRLDPLPRRLAGVVVEVHTTLAPQLVVENKTKKTLEVLDEKGVPFLRMRPGGVDGNFNSDALYRSNSPLPSSRPATARDAKPNWKLLSSRPAWGWFDQRLRVHSHDAVITGIADASPIRGSWQARLTSPHEPLPGVHVILLPGRVPALFLEASTEETVVVLGASGEPFLRFYPRGVDANVRSPSWRENALAHGEEAPIAIDAKAPPQWTTVSSSPKYGWVEFRAWPGTDEPTSKGPVAFRWSIPLEVGTKREFVVEGVTNWKPARRSAGH